MADMLTLAFLNFVFGVSISAVAICRLSKMPEGTVFYRAAPYAIALTAGLVSASTPWLGYWPSKWHVFITFGFLTYLVASKNVSATR